MVVLYVSGVFIELIQQMQGAQLIIDLTAKKLISYDSEKCSEKNLLKNFVAFIQGLISFLVDIPGTAYHKCLQGRKNAMRMLVNLLQERREKPRKQPIDFVDHVLEELKKEETMLTEEIFLGLMFVLLFVSFETTSLALTLAIKFLSDHPAVLKKLTICTNSLSISNHTNCYSSLKSMG
ncbi:putative abieta-7,13-dien-18-ol hydroxylase [Rosa chinensis]|uniref:Putative abieta-7,13-dien-18-ol hydroxylase n=1 Tax=Rosa chinensis TaxID=74649 RepID=A0A2P6RAU6_ROSCH|nr:putative abieta-7,13-dien-18-ol hydroxylase [Rosa chinensis]